MCPDDVAIRTLERHEIDDLWSIDRGEVIDAIYRYRNGGLVLEPERHDVQGWPPHEIERDRRILVDCFEHGGTFYGAFDGARLTGAAVLEGRFIGRGKDQLQLKFLHVSRRCRGAGLGRALFAKAISKASALGARRLYVSATPSENTVQFYLRRGCRLADELDVGLFELEPDDIHLDFELPA